MDSQRRNKKPIIVCDDDNDIREFLVLALKKAGYEVLGASGFSDLMYFMENVRPSLILLDIRMPEWDGFFVAETLRKRGNTVPIIFMTAHDNKFSRIYAPAIGAVGYFTKPLEIEAVLAKIDETLASSTLTPTSLPTVKTQSISL
jgi:two-component system, OmpR family, response regulator